MLNQKQTFWRHLALVATLFACAPLSGKPLSDRQQAVCNEQSGAASHANNPAPGTEQTTIKADSVKGDRNSEQMEFSGNVKLWQSDIYAETDRLLYYQSMETVDLFGSLYLHQPGLEANAELGHFALESEQGWLESAQFSLTEGDGRGEASRVELDGTQLSSYQDALYTTCPPGKNDWSINAAKLKIDREKGWGSAYHATLRLGGLPVFYLPYLTFPVDDRRKTGLLIPSFGSSNRLGSELILPYYINLAPNYDATLTPRWMSKRGLMLGAEFRFLGSSQSGLLSGELLPDDKIESSSHDTKRSSVKFQHRSRPAANLQTRIDLSYVSDMDYLDDFGSGLSITSSRHLERVGEITFNHGNWRLSGKLQEFQTVDEALSKTSYPYRRLPQLLASYQQRFDDYHTEFALDAEYVHFDHDVKVAGQRFSLRPSIQIPVRRSWGHLTPSLGLNYVSYQLDELAPGDRHPDFFVPTFSLDGGLVFERDTNWFGSSAIQTLEPRLYYLYAPYDEQSQAPDFDTSDISLSYSSLFRNNRFSGGDRVGDARQIAFGLTSRWLQSDNGMQRLRASIGQIYYLQDRKVQLTGPTEEANDSAIVAELAARLGQHWSSSLTTRWDPHLDGGKIDRGKFSLHYKTPQQRLFNIDYNFTRNSVEDLDVSFYWPMNNQFTLFGKWKHSYKYEKDMNTMLGLSYSGRCCWTLRALYQRYIENAATDEEEDTRFMLQLELRGLGKLGEEVQQTLSEEIYGY